MWLSAEILHIPEIASTASRPFLLFQAFKSTFFSGKSEFFDCRQLTMPMKSRNVSIHFGQTTVAYSC